MADYLFDLSFQELEELLIESLHPNTFKYEPFLGSVDVVLIKDGHGPYGILGSGETQREALIDVFLLKPRSWRGKKNEKK